MSETLKPCPCCRGVADFLTMTENGKDISCAVFCNDCGLTIEKPTQAEAFAAWNTRTQPPPAEALQAEVERLKQEVASLDQNGGLIVAALRQRVERLEKELLDEVERKTALRQRVAELEGALRRVDAGIQIRELKAARHVIQSALAAYDKETKP